MGFGTKALATAHPMLVYKLMRTLKEDCQCLCDSSVEREAPTDAGNVG
jgi:hypothetical protein